MIGGFEERFQRGSLRSFLIGVLGAIVLGACGLDVTENPPAGNGSGNGSGNGGPGADFPTIRTTDELTFEDEVTLISVGGSVRWVSDSSLDHTVTPDGHDEFERVEWQQRGGVMLEHTFTEPGIFEFYCEYHVDHGMTGRVEVHGVRAVEAGPP